MCVCEGLNGQARFERDIKYDFWKSNNMPVGYMRGQFLGRLKVKLLKGGSGRWGNGCSVTILITVPMQATFITQHTLLQPKAKTHIRLQSNIFCSGAHIFVSLLIRAAVSEASHLCRYRNGASRENTSNPAPILFLFISTILMSSDSLGNKIHSIHQERPQRTILLLLLLCSQAGLSSWMTATDEAELPA